MQLHKTRHTTPLLLLIIILSAVGCSTQKNTAKSRWWHSFNAKYNTYYNGTLAYIDGSLEKENGNKDNFTEMIPLYTVGNKTSKEIGKGNFDKAIEKCQKAIKLHSIKKKPEWTKNRRKNEKDIEWLNRKEYNPFLWKAWLLMGRSQFYSGAFDDAASTFAYMSRIYQTQPAIYGRARAWLAKTYIEQDWIYDAEDVIRNMQRDSIHKSAQKEWDYTYADYYIHTGEYDKALPYLKKVIKHEMRKKQKARELYLLGQLETALGHKEEAYKAYRRVVRQNPPYEVEFNAQIAMTEVMAGTHAKKMISKLKRMARSDNNKDYLDQVYYAIGNIYLAEKDTAKAISAYEKGNEKATRSGIEKGVLLLKLGDLYWTLEKFSDAQRCYGEAIGLLDKEREDYEQLSNRSKMLDELVPYTEAVHLQDSLQELAKMSEKERNEAIDRVIEALKKKEKEEKRKQAEADAQQTLQKNSAMGNRNQQNRQQPNTPNANANANANGKWYFYNQLAVQQGKQAFEKQWGKRENVDDWQRVNKTVVANNVPLEEMSEEMRDSIAQEEAKRDSLEQVTDSAQNDPHKREYYLAQIPFTEEQIEASNLIIEDGLYNSGVIFKDKLDHLVLSEKALRRLTDNYPEYEGMDNVYYHLFLLYSRMNLPAVAETYIAKLQEEFPSSQWTGILSDPYFKENAILGEQIEDSLYASTYNAFKGDRYDEVRSNSRISEERFPLGANRDKFLFINGLSKLNDGDGDGCLAEMNLLVEKFPQSKLAEMAGMIVNGVKAGKQLHGGKFDLGDVWSRRSVVLNDSDSIAARQFTVDRNANFVFMVAYKPDSVNENHLLFELARYNFTSYMVRNFDIAITEDEGLHIMQVTGFRNYDEVLQYARQLYQQKNIVNRLGKSRTIIISEQNLPLLGKQFSYDDYGEFYDKHFAPMKISTEQLLELPVEIGYAEDEEPEVPSEQPGETPTPIGGNENYIPTEFIEIPEDTPKGNNNSEDIIPNNIIEEPTKQVTPVQQDNYVIDEPAPVKPVEDNTIVIDEPMKETPVEDNTIVIDEPTSETPVEDDTIIIDEPEQKPQQNNEDDDIIILDDDDSSTNDDTDTDVIIVDDEEEKIEKKDGNEIEDEYFELDGF